MRSWCRKPGRNVYTRAFYILCGPFIFCTFLRRQYVAQRHEEHSLQNRLDWNRDIRRVRPLSPVRQRELSQSATTERNQQKDCRLFSRLPLEIRTMIWHYVLGGQRYHLMQVPKRVGHHRCHAGDTSDPGRSCCLPAMAWWRFVDGTPSFYDYRHRYPGARVPGGILDEILPLPLNSEPNTLALLRGCQRIYREAIDIPYHANIFDIDDPQTLLDLRQTIPRQRLRAMKNLRIYVEAYPPSATMPAYPWFKRMEGVWTLMWHTIAFDMVRLDSLSLTIQSKCRTLGRFGKNPPWCANLREVHGLKSFQMILKEIDTSHDENSDNDTRALTQALRECMYQPRLVQSPAQNKKLSPIDIREMS